MFSRFLFGTNTKPKKEETDDNEPLFIFKETFNREYNIYVLKNTGTRFVCAIISSPNTVGPQYTLSEILNFPYFSFIVFSPVEPDVSLLVPALLKAFGNVTNGFFWIDEKISPLLQIELNTISQRAKINQTLKLDGCTLTFSGDALVIHETGTDYLKLDPLSGKNHQSWLLYATFDNCKRVPVTSIGNLTIYFKTDQMDLGNLRFSLHFPQKQNFGVPICCAYYFGNSGDNASYQMFNYIDPNWEISVNLDIDCHLDMANRQLLFQFPSGIDVQSCFRESGGQAVVLTTTSTSFF